MTTPQASPSPPQPTIGVHVLSEFVYCSRAGLLVYGQDEEDRGDEEPIQRLDYLPMYELNEIDEHLLAHLQGIWVLIFLAAGVVAATLALSRFVHGAFFVGGVVALAILGWAAIREARQIFELQRRREACHRANPAEPNADSDQQEMVDWWALKAAHFESTRCQESLHDQALNLRGRPWRIIRRDDLAIPVFVRNKPGLVKESQRVRVAAYCHLISTCEGKQSPYGIVMDRGTFQGVAVKCGVPQLRAIERWLVKARSAICNRELHDIRDPGPPPDFKPCKRCPHGRLRKHRPGVTETRYHGEVVPVYGIRRGEKQVIFHSPCGDSHCWVAPHELTAGPYSE